MIRGMLSRSRRPGSVPTESHLCSRLLHHFPWFHNCVLLDPVNLRRSEDFYLDLLFYDLSLRGYVVVELKTGPCQPEYACKLNFHLTAADDLLRDRDRDGPTIGLLRCKSKNRVVVEYALKDTHRPIGVSAWQLTRALPAAFNRNLPTVATLEAELTRDSSDEKVRGPLVMDPSTLPGGSPCRAARAAGMAP